MYQFIKSFFYNIIPFKIKKFIHFKFSEYINNSENLLHHTANIQIDNIHFKLELPKELNAHKTYIDDFKNGKIYEETMIFCLLSILRKISNFVFLDLGSYVGYYSMFVAKFREGKNEIFSVESNLDYFLCIEKSKNINNFHNIKVLNRIISNSSEDHIVYKNTVIKKENIRKIIEESLDSDEIINSKMTLKNGEIHKSITLDNLCAVENIKPSIVKIDVHGAEGKVLLGAQNVLLRYVRIIFLELHPDEYLNKYSDNMTRNNVLDILHKNNFRTYIISPFRYTLRSIGYKNFKNNKKLQFLEVNDKNLLDIFFDREVDVFILALHKDVDIKVFDCFN